MAEFLEEQARCPDQMQVNAKIREVLAPAPGERLLEVGSGTGVLCRLMAPDVAPDGQVIGLEASPLFAAVARCYALEHGLSDRVRYVVGMAEALPYADNGFDGAFAARLLLHVAEPEVVVREMARVVRPGGRIVLMDWDFDTVAVDHPDRELTRRLLHWRADHHGGDNWSGRRLLARMVAAGLRDVSITPVAVVARDKGAALTQSLWRAAQVAREGGGITPAEHDAWVGELKTRIAEGRFFASIVYFLARGRVG